MFSRKLTIKPPGAQLARNNLTRGLAGYWLLNEGGGEVARDLSGNNNHLAFSTTKPTWKRENAGGLALDFSGSGDYAGVAVTTTSSLYIIGDQITMGAWFYDPGSPAPDGRILGHVTSAFSYELLVENGAQAVGVQLNLGGSNEYFVVPGGFGGLDFMHNQLNLLMATYDGATIIIYVNGVVVGSTSASGNIAATTDGFALGARGDDGSGAFNSSLLQAFIWNRALSSAEAQQLYIEPYAMVAGRKLIFAEATGATDVTHAADVIVAAFSLPAFTVSTVQNITVSPDVLSASFTLPAYALVTANYLTPTVLSATFSLPVVSVSTTGDITISVDTLSATFSLPAFTVITGATVSSTVQTATFTLPTFTVTGAASFSANPLSATFSIPQPLVTVPGTTSVYYTGGISANKRMRRGMGIN